MTGYCAIEATLPQNTEIYLTHTPDGDLKISIEGAWYTVSTTIDHDTIPPFINALQNPTIVGTTFDTGDGTVTILDLGNKDRRRDITIRIGDATYASCVLTPQRADTLTTTITTLTERTH